MVEVERTVGELLVERPSRSRVFEQLGIDYCCGGRKRLTEACSEQGLDAVTVARLLAAPEAPPHAGPDLTPAAMSLTELADHIEATHHAYLRRELPRLTAMVRKVTSAHGLNHPWLIELDEVFGGLCDELREHMDKEERVLFPLIRGLEPGQKPGAASGDGGGLGQPIRELEHEHEAAGAALGRMRRLSDDYRPPQGACNTFIAMLDGLAALERDMHQHVHKENNILFPRAEALAQGE